MSQVVVFDYGSGNIHSVVRALGSVGASVCLTSDAEASLGADGLVVPGVGAFAACMDQLRSVGGVEIIRQRVRSGKPLLGICVGHQILFSWGEEHGRLCEGVGIFPGTVRVLPTPRRPHMGWNQVIPDQASSILGVGLRYYFVHSYASLEPTDLPEGAGAAWATHDGARLIAAVEYGPILSTQFHPEKSGPVGLGLLRRWVTSLGGL